MIPCRLTWDSEQLRGGEDGCDPLSISAVACGHSAPVQTILHCPQGISGNGCNSMTGLKQ